MDEDIVELTNKDKFGEFDAQKMRTDDYYLLIVYSRVRENLRRDKKMPEHMLHMASCILVSFPYLGMNEVSDSVLQQTADKISGILTPLLN